MAHCWAEVGDFAATIQISLRWVWGVAIHIPPSYTQCKQVVNVDALACTWQPWRVSERWADTFYERQHLPSSSHQCHCLHRLHPPPPPPARRLHHSFANTLHKSSTDIRHAAVHRNAINLEQRRPSPLSRPCASRLVFSLQVSVDHGGGVEGRRLVFLVSRSKSDSVFLSSASVGCN